MMNTISSTIPISFKIAHKSNDKYNINHVENKPALLGNAKLSIDNYKANFLAFNGNLSKTIMTKIPKGNCENKVKHQTSFFRDPETIEFVADYINTQCKNNKEIRLADFGCAIGEEAYTIAMMANDNRLSITGYDVSPNVIDLANRGIYTICSKDERSYLYSTNEDHFLNKENKAILNDKEKTYHALFHQCFKQIDTLPEDLANNEHFRAAHDKDTSKHKYFQVNKETISPQVSFEVGNINEIDSVLTPESTDVIVFKNALYHLLPEDRTNKGYVDFCLTKTDDLFKEINTALKPGGIFVLGRLSIDHMATPTIFKRRNGEKVDDLPIHKILKENGFEAVHYDSVHKDYSDGVESTIFLPSVWQKKV